MWLQFDENPGKGITDQLKAAGFTWDRSAFFTDDSGKVHRGAWIKELARDQEWRVRAEAQRLLSDLGNQIRSLNGLEPTTPSGLRDR